MKLSDYLHARNCILQLASSSKPEAIAEIVGHLARLGEISDREKFLEAIVARERLGSTGIGNQVAIPHAPAAGAGDIVIGFGRSAGGIEFGSIDGEKVKLVFLLGANPDNLTLYLKLLAKLAKLTNDASLRDELMLASTPDAVIDIVKRWESEETSSPGSIVH